MRSNSTRYFWDFPQSRSYMEGYSLNYDRLFRPLSFRVLDAPLGLEFRPHRLALRIATTIVRVIWATTLFASRPIVRLWERYLATKLLQLLSSLAFGFPPREFAGGLIIAKNSLQLPKYFKAESVDVTDILLASSPPTINAAVQTRDRRYAFLWDDVERRTRLSNSWLWHRVSMFDTELVRRYARLPQLEYSGIRQRLEVTCLMAEQRIREVAGTVELSHSSYYSNEKIIKIIANFIASGKSPERPSNTDVITNMSEY
jgi:hypothetical protein